MTDPTGIDVYLSLYSERSTQPTSQRATWATPESARMIRSFMSMGLRIRITLWW